MGKEREEDECYRPNKYCLLLHSDSFLNYYGNDMQKSVERQMAAMSCMDNHCRCFFCVFSSISASDLLRQGKNA